MQRLLRGLFVGQDTIQAVAFFGIMPGVFLLYELLLGAVFPAVHKKATSKREFPWLVQPLRIWEFNWSVLDAHNAVGYLPKAHQFEK